MYVWQKPNASTFITRQTRDARTHPIISGMFVASTLASKLKASGCVELFFWLAVLCQTEQCIQHSSVRLKQQDVTVSRWATDVTMVKVEV
jgi:hypothetical protein